MDKGRETEGASVVSCLVCLQSCPVFSIGTLPDLPQHIKETGLQLQGVCGVLQYKLNCMRRCGSGAVTSACVTQSVGVKHLAFDCGSLCSPTL